MTTVLAPNVHNIAIEGDFDDAQALVKAMFNDARFADRFALSAVNSINWARLMAQVVYYFYAAVRLGAPERAIAFSVPTGNFGDVFAGYVAARMGLPIAQADRRDQRQRHPPPRAVDRRLFARGRSRRPRRRRWISRSRPTSSGCCSISAAATARRWRAQMAGFERAGAMRLTNAQHRGRRGAVRQRPRRRRRHGAGDALGVRGGGAGDRPAHRRSRSPPRAARHGGSTRRSSRSPPRTRPSSATRSSAPPASARRCPRASATCSTARSATPRCPPPSRRSAATSPSGRTVGMMVAA